jgi:hypothetical protein
MITNDGLCGIVAAFDGRGRMPTTATVILSRSADGQRKQDRCRGGSDANVAIT